MHSTGGLINHNTENIWLKLWLALNTLLKALNWINNNMSKTIRQRGRRDTALLMWLEYPINMYPNSNRRQSFPQLRTLFCWVMRTHSIWPHKSQPPHQLTSTNRLPSELKLLQKMKRKKKKMCRMNYRGKCSLCHKVTLNLTCKNVFSWFLDFSRNFWSMDLNGSLLREGSWTFFKEGKHWWEKQKEMQGVCGGRILSCVIRITSQNMQQLDDSSRCHSNSVRDMAQSHCRLGCLHWSED